MPNYTSNYNLTKPLPTELYDIEVQNGNMDKIDEALVGLKTKIVDTESHSSNKSNPHGTTAKQVGAPNIYHVGANLSSVGWYRVGTINTANTGAENTSNSASILQIAISGIFAERNPVPFMLTAYHNYGSTASLYQYPTTANPTQVDSVRLYPIDNNTCGLDVHYMQNNTNRVNVSVMPYIGSFTPATLENVSDLTEDARAIVALSKDGNIDKTVVDNTVTTSGTNAVSGAAVAAYVTQQISAIADYEVVKF